MVCVCVGGCVGGGGGVGGGVGWGGGGGGSLCMAGRSYLACFVAYIIII